MDGLAHFSIGAVLLVDDPQPIVENASTWCDAARDACAASSAAELRFYTPSSDTTLTRALSATGMMPATEIAMAGGASRLAIGASVGEGTTWRLREVSTEALWALKDAVHARTPERPDGKSADSRAWVGAERRKVDAGYMTPYLIEHDGEACGAFGLSFMPDLLRVKNFFLEPSYRAKGGASAALRLIAQAALARGIEAVGCFALPGSVGERLYASNGFVEVGRQLEWITPASGVARASRNAVA
jgi:RimJ/RimL family protein N-acetyltransferase